MVHPRVRSMSYSNAYSSVHSIAYSIVYTMFTFQYISLCILHSIFYVIFQATFHCTFQSIFQSTVHDIFQCTVRSPKKKLAQGPHGPSHCSSSFVADSSVLISDTLPNVGSPASFFLSDTFLEIIHEILPRFLFYRIPRFIPSLF